MTTCQLFNKLPFIKFILQHFNKICSMVSKTVRSLYRYPYAGLVLSCEGKLSCSATPQLKHHQRIYHIPSKPNQYRTFYLTNIQYNTSLHCVTGIIVLLTSPVLKIARVTVHHLLPFRRLYMQLLPNHFLARKEPNILLLFITDKDK